MKKIVAILLTLCMVLSSLVFALPVSAEASVAVQTDYSAYLTADDSYIINPAWADEITDTTADGTELSGFYFNGAVRTVKYVKGKHFTSFADAYTAVFEAGLVNETNYFDFCPTFIFAPGDYSEHVHIPTGATVLGPQAGISPNSELTADDMTLSGVMANGGWKENPDRTGDTNEASFSNGIFFTTRHANASGIYTDVSDVNKLNALEYPWYKEMASVANPGEAVECVVDGVRITASSVQGISLTGAEKGTTVQLGDDTTTAVKLAGHRTTHAVIRNVIDDSSSILINCWNGTREKYDIEVYGLRAENTRSTNLFDRYIWRLKLQDSFVSNYTGALTQPWNIASPRNENPIVELSDNIFYNNASTKLIQLNPGSLATLDVMIDGNIFYDSYGIKSNLIKLTNTTSKKLTVEVTNNIIHQSAASYALFNGVPSIITGGTNDITFNYNRVTGAVSSVLPSSGHDAAVSFNSLLYNFNYNFIGETPDSVGVAPAFASGYEPLGATGYSAYDWKNPVYYLDYDMTQLAPLPEGLGFEPEYNYFASKKLEDIPLTYEAWVKLDSTIPDDVALGTVVGNSVDLRNSHVALRVIANGVPELFWRDEMQCEYHAAFDTVDLRNGEWTHIAVVSDGENGAVHCYINGELVQTVRNRPELNAAVIQYPLVVGGENGQLNRNCFRGSIKGVTLYSDMRSADEIKADITAANLDDPALIADYTVSRENEKKGITDNSKNGYDLTCSEMWLTEEQMEDIRDDSFESAYTVVTVGDTQCTAQYAPEKLPTLYQWIVDNKEQKNIQYVLGMGDITNNDIESEWISVKNAISIMDGKIEYSLVRGNHDVYEGGELFDTYFANDPDYVDQFKKHGGFYEDGSVENTWRTLTLGTNEYLIMNLDWAASDSILEWAGGVIAAHPEHRVIVVTHGYLFANGDHYNADHQSGADATHTTELNNGDQIWEKLVSRYANIEMVLCGHITDDEVVVSQVKGENGNTVTEMLIDHQHIDLSLDGLGIIGLMSFSEDGNTISLEYYSTVLKKYFKSTNQTVIDLTAEGDEVVDIGTDETPDGSGTEEDPYLISKREHLLWMARGIVNGSTASFDGVYFKQTQDIDLEGNTIRAIGYYFNDPTAMAAFGGTYDGGGYKIMNGQITSKRDTSNFRLRYGYGLFGVIYGAEIKNVTLDNITVVGRAMTGTVVGWAASHYDGTATSDFNKITNCHATESCQLITIMPVGRSVSSSIAFDNHWRAGLTGGIAGKLHATTVSYCTSAVRFAVEAKFTHSGGIAGAAGLNTEIDHCKFTGGIELVDDDIKVSARIAVGGIVGLLSPFSQTVLQNDSDNDLETPYGATNIGTLRIKNSVNSGYFVYTGDEMSDDLNLVWGGILGYAGWLDTIEYDGDNYPYYIENCYNLYSRQTEEVLSAHGNSWIGGIVGKAHLTAGSAQGNVFLKDCYSVTVDIDDSSDLGTAVIGTNEYRVENKRNADGYLGVEVIGDSVSTMTAEEMAPSLQKIDAEIELGGHSSTHTVETVDAREATCTDIGWNEHLACTECEYTYGYVEKPAVGHSVELIEQKDPGYSADGYKAHYYCAKCNCYFTDESADNVIADIDAWKAGEGKIARYALPDVVQTSDNVVTLIQEGTGARRVYWGYIGTEYTDYTGFDEFVQQAGDSYTADYAPADGHTYDVTGVGFYRFIINYVDDNGKRVDIVKTIEVTKSANILPEITADGQYAVLSLGEASVRKLYYGYIGEQNTPYVGFDTTVFTTADFGPKDGDAYLMEKAGYYRFVVNYKSGDRYVDVVYTVYSSATANSTVPDFEFDGAVATLEHNSAYKVNKLYVGYIGTEAQTVTSWSEFTEICKKRYCVMAPADGSQYQLENPGYYAILINYSDGEKTHDVIYTFETEN